MIHQTPNTVIDDTAIQQILALSQPRLLAELIAIFNGDMQAELPKLRMLREVGSFKDMRTLAHYLKSTSAFVGALRLTAVLGQIQNSTDESPPPSEIIAVLEVEAAMAADALAAYLPLG